MLEDMRKAPDGSVVLLHACAHNPTGAPGSALCFSMQHIKHALGWKGGNERQGAGSAGQFLHDMLHSLRAALIHQQISAKWTSDVLWYALRHHGCTLFGPCVVLPGVDPSPDQWHGILKVVKEKGFLPFFDSAYQVRLSNPEHLGCQCLSGLTYVSRQ